MNRFSTATDPRAFDLARIPPLTFVLREELVGGYPLRDLVEISPAGLYWSQDHEIPQYGGGQNGSSQSWESFLREGPRWHVDRGVPGGEEWSARVSGEAVAWIRSHLEACRRG